MRGDIRLLFIITVLLFPSIANAQNENVPDGPWKIDEWKKTPDVTWLDRKSPIRSLTYRSEPFNDLTTTDVFAFNATPGSISGDATRDRNLPAVVLIHGGGGTAFAEWVWLWAKRVVLWKH